VRVGVKVRAGEKVIIEKEKLAILAILAISAI